jgi:hypothetical protein
MPKPVLNSHNAEGAFQMKSIAIKISSLLLIFAVSFPSLACEPSGNVVSNNADTESFSDQTMQRITDHFNKGSF